MPAIRVLQRDGASRRIPARLGRSAMEAIHAAGLTELLAFCGGWCACATCHVLVDPAFLPRTGPAGEIESELLDATGHRTPSSRLACQIVMTPELDGITLTIAPDHHPASLPAA